MPGTKRHHYVPKLLLRRFSTRPQDKNPILWKLEMATGKPSKTAVDGEAVVGHYYRTHDLPGDPAQVETDLAMIEGIAAGHLDQLLKGVQLNPVARVELATFLHLQHRRTPRGRQSTTELIEQQFRILTEVSIGRGDRIREFLEKQNPNVTDVEVEAFRDHLLTDWREGRIQVEATSDHEVLGMFVAGNEVGEAIASQMSWCLLRSQPAAEFVLADHPVCIFDPSVPAGHGVGWLSSPSVEATLPLDRQTCLLLTPGPPTTIESAATAGRVADLNLRSYASAEWAYYGSGQGVVQGTRAHARRRRDLVEQYRPRKPHFFVFETMESDDGRTIHLGTRDFEPTGKPTRGPMRPPGSQPAPPPHRDS
jgi:hypothetical protein